MSLWRHLTRGLRVLTNRAAADEDVADELQDYLENATAAREQAGLSPEDARRSARLELGNAAVIRDQLRSYGWENMIETLLGDLHYGVRQLWKNAGFASTAIFILALGIGATTAIFSAVNPILFEPLPYPHPDQIMMISELRDGGSRRPNFGTYRGLAERTHSFDAISVMKPWQPAMVGIGEPELFDGQRVGADYVRALGVLPALGRDFQVADDTFNGPNVAILSDRLWHRRFNADPQIIGRQITLQNGSSQLGGSDSFTVIGVMPSGFENVLSP
ncbi:MAG TPA: ABC transporter permease, partial [Terriglobales bacterium]|nr:ABC transporter permease [Terriglobales bacterium]